MNDEKIINNENVAEKEISEAAKEITAQDCGMAEETDENTVDATEYEADGEADGKTETETAAEAGTEAEAMKPFTAEAAKPSGLPDIHGAEKADSAEAEAEADADMPAEEAQSDAAQEEKSDIGGEDEYSVELSEQEIRAATSNPMFAIFARGKKQSFDAVCADFLRMTHAARDTGSKRMATPAGACAVSRGVALSDRQRNLAREYGMSYREYYDLINGIPTKLYK